MKKQTIAYHEAGHAVVARRLGYPVDGASIVSEEASEGRVKLPNPRRRKDAELDRHRIWVAHAAIIALDGAVDWYSTCTAKMGRDSMSVVDANLKVYGIENLCIADGSIMPSITQP